MGFVAHYDFGYETHQGYGSKLTHLMQQFMYGLQIVTEHLQPSTNIFFFFFNSWFYFKRFRKGGFVGVPEMKENLNWTSNSVIVLHNFAHATLAYYEFKQSRNMMGCNLKHWILYIFPWTTRWWTFDRMLNIVNEKRMAWANRFAKFSNSNLTIFHNNFLHCFKTKIYKNMKSCLEQYIPVVK